MQPPTFPVMKLWRAGSFKVALEKYAEKHMQHIL